MSVTPKDRTGARVLVDQLLAQGVERASCVPGESYLSVLDALIGSGVDMITCRQEGGASMMAEAWGKLSGRPGICFVTRGPGATNAAAGVHVAAQDSTPMILFVGQVARGMKHREAFQELDYGAVFGTMAKWVVEIDDAARIPELVARAFRVAMQGRPGPVVIALPEDMLDDVVQVADAPRVEPVETAPAAGDAAALAELLAGAERPFAIFGGSRWDEAAVASFTGLCERYAIPFAASFRRAGMVPAQHPNYAGDLSLGANPALVKAIGEADLVLVMGSRMSEISSQSYTLLPIPSGAQKLVHVHADPDEIGRVYQPALGISATPKGIAPVLDGLSPEAPRQGEWVSAARAAYLDWSEEPRENPGALQMGKVLTWMRDALPDDAILTNGAGNFAVWLNRYYRFTQFNTHLAPTSGSMGYGFPAGIAAQRARPDQVVVNLAGDGDFMMTSQEFATCAHHGIPLIVVLVDNGMYGTIRMHQEREFPERVSSTSLTNPDFAALAEAHGGFGQRVETAEDFPAAFEAARASGKPAILHLILDPEALSPTATIAGLRARKG
ncbi:acetolactate synthase large subunit [Pseudooceanicola nanhaiensis]|jgi:acetolactate synthase-1/2/3 large subunit|uniref:Acetolactate synthase large subunit n=1 Tax=Pseudooceanicola nanhaiensis TaxID=375761 RepID=A0A917SSN3_9RHOB|nr:thiamine pyrophosphate-binding protein [Pseudooceanicola nanhaiensis]GGL95809.1 acetolactate synthase large subunit [Pseudooceanicola nanhaiensis]